MSVKGVVRLLLVSLTALAVTSGEVDSGRLKRSDDVAPLQAVVDNLSQQVTQLTAQMATVRTELNAVKNKVAFHARHSTDPFSVGSQGTIVYDTAITNVGNAYDHETGFFTAPVSGTYAFFVNCMAVVGTSEETYVEVDGTVVAGCYSWRPNGSPIEQGATMATLHLQAGQRVCVRLLGDAENVRGWLWNTFSGFLVQADV